MNISWDSWKWNSNDEIVEIESNIFCLLYTSDAADEEDSVDLGGRRIIKNKLKTEKRKYWLKINFYFFDKTPIY